ncbi:hypothetical protein ACX93W_15535 [Paenibacillus sp. CAU 1782]
MPRGTFRNPKMLIAAVGAALAVLAVGCLLLLMALRGMSGRRR